MFIMDMKNRVFYNEINIFINKLRRIGILVLLSKNSNEIDIEVIAYCLGKEV